MPPPTPVSLFYSYSHKDEALRDKLETHLSLLKDQDVIRDWHDRRIEAGTEWDGAISENLDKAGIILLLVSADFVASRYCLDVEVARAMERHEAGTARVIPVILRPVAGWQFAPFGKLQALPRGGRPVTKWGNRDEAFADVARGIREAAKSLAAGTPGPSSPVTPPPGVPTTFPGGTTGVERASLVRNLTRLTPSDMATLVTLLEGAATHVSRHGTVPEQAAELVRWAESPNGCGDGPLFAALSALDAGAVAYSERGGAIPVQVGAPDGPPPEGGLPLDDPSYIGRSTDHAFLKAVSRGDGIVLLRGARQVGKTSLLARGLQGARSSGARTVFTDFQGFDRSELGSLDAFYQTLAGRIAQGLGIDDRLEDLWNPKLPPNKRFEGFLEYTALATVPGRFVWAMDEADRLFSFDFATQFFGLLRSWWDARATEPSRPWTRLTLVIAYATEAHLFIKDLRQSPFNVGTRVPLADFTYEEVAELNRRRGAPIKSGLELKRFQGFVGGHPFLTNRGLYEMAARGLGVRAFEKEAVREDGFLGDHLRHIVIVLGDDSALREVITGMLRGKPCPTAEDFYRLRAAGLVAGESSRSARVRCRLYENYLREALR